MKGNCLGASYLKVQAKCLWEAFSFLIAHARLSSERRGKKRSSMWCENVPLCAQWACGATVAVVWHRQKSPKYSHVTKWRVLHCIFVIVSHNCRFSNFCDACYTAWNILYWHDTTPTDLLKTWISWAAMQHTERVERMCSRMHRASALHAIWQKSSKGKSWVPRTKIWTFCDSTL